MTPTAHPDLTLPLIPEAAQRNHGPVPLAAYVPIAVAIFGVAVILVGGIGARDQGERQFVTPPAVVALSR